MQNFSEKNRIKTENTADLNSVHTVYSKSGKIGLYFAQPQKRFRLIATLGATF